MLIAILLRKQRRQLQGKEAGINNPLVFMYREEGDEKFRNPRIWTPARAGYWSLGREVGKGMESRGE